MPVRIKAVRVRLAGLLDRPAYTRVHLPPYVDVLLHVLVSTHAKLEHPFINLGGLLQIFGGFRVDVDIWKTLLLSPGARWSIDFGTLEAGIPIAACLRRGVSRVIGLIFKTERVITIPDAQPVLNVGSSAAPNFLVTATDIGVSRPGHGESRPDWVVGYY